MKPNQPYGSPDYYHETKIFHFVIKTRLPIPSKKSHQKFFQTLTKIFFKIYGTSAHHKSPCKHVLLDYTKKRRQVHQYRRRSSAKTGLIK